MLRMVMRDLQWRLRRFVLAGLATAIVFALTLVLTGVSTSVHSETRRVVERFGADQWLIQAGGSGPFTGAAALAASTADEVASMPGVERAEPVLILRGTVPGDPVMDLNIIGIRIGGMGAPEPELGRKMHSPGEVIVDRQLGLEPGDQLVLGPRTLTVAGVDDGISFMFGIPTVFAPIECLPLAQGAQCFRGRRSPRDETGRL